MEAEPEARAPVDWAETVKAAMAARRRVVNCIMAVIGFGWLGTARKILTSDTD